MRDLIVALFILGSMPLSFRKPFLGILMFSLLAYMRLQDLAWGFAQAQRWSMYIAVISVAGYMADSNRKMPVLNVRVLLLVLMVLHVGVGLFFAQGGPRVDFAAYQEFVKIIGIAIFTTAVVRTRSHLRILVWVIALSLGFHGTKNGLFATIKMGNLFISHGPGGMIRDNNDFALAVAMIIPWIYYLAQSETNPTLVRILKFMVPLCALTVISTRSRGGTLSLAFMGALIIWRSRNRLIGVILGLFAVVVVVAMAPEEYKERLGTIQSYEEDGSAMGRIRAWKVAFRMIDAHPLYGVGFNRFAINHLAFEPNPTLGQQSGHDALVAHNSYLQIWAEGGTPAFLIYLALMAGTFIDCWRVRWRAKKLYVDSWILSYCSMFEVSLATFMLGSIFLNRAAFDLVYHLFAVVIVFGVVARRQMDEDEASSKRLPGGDGGEGSEGWLAPPMPVKQTPRFRRVALEGRGRRS
ncbi:MAG: putative inorganic carbon (HCO3(-)) transporter [Planctomycetota bacterium]|jgi:putative inorganic carbon (HCO3(-)) transporter